MTWLLLVYGFVAFVILWANVMIWAAARSMIDGSMPDYDRKCQQNAQRAAKRAVISPLWPVMALRFFTALWKDATSVDK